MDKWNAVLTTLPKKFPRKGRKVFAQCLKKLKEHRFLKKLFFRKLFLWTSRIEFWHSLRNFFEKRPKNLFSMCKINLKNLNFSEHCLSSDCSFGDVNCNFDNPSKSFSEKGQKFLAQGLKLISKFKILFSFFLSLWTSWKQSRQHHRKYSDERPKLFGSMSENYLKFSILSKEKCFVQIVLMET